MTRVMFYVQHLMGIGHQKRASAIARAMVKRGLDLTYVTGGFPIADLDVTGATLKQLAPCKAADSTFLKLLDENNKPVSEEWKNSRKQDLLKTYDDIQPDILIIEMFPFGRRAMEFELIPLIERARRSSPRPRIVCSVRDIIDPKPKPGRYEEIVSRINAWFDDVLVHGDPQLISFDATFPLASSISDKLQYTGYVVTDDHVTSGTIGTEEVVVTAGSGRVGERIFEIALEARALCPLKDAVWRFLVGDGVATGKMKQYKNLAPAGVIIERFRDDYPTLLSNAALSISRAGYNTITDLLHARTPAILIPFTEGIENEQLVRSRALARHGLMQFIEQDKLTPISLAEQITQILCRKPMEVSLDLSGTETSTRIVSDIVSITQH